MNTLIAEASETKYAATPSTFDLWAGVYDTQVNPFLSLEKRILKSLLPDVHGLTVLDAGCGTGRMLDIFATCGAGHVIGVDSSPAMLERARSAHEADIRYGSCTALPVEDASIDCVISSFVLSYITELEAFADELLRVTRPGAAVLLSDMHPSTAHELNWRRSFRCSGREIEVASSNWQIDQIRDSFMRRGFRVTACVEPNFSTPEHMIFAHARKASSFARVQKFPAIYVLKFVRESVTAAFSLAFTNARVALTALDTSSVSLATRNKKIDLLDSKCVEPDASTLDLNGYLVLPGLINAHDHLEFGLFPRLGHGPYGNAAQWAEDIHFKDAALIALHRGILRDTRIAWGAIRNLLAGVTTVCHHNPITDEMLSEDFPVSVLRHFDWAHSLAIDGDVATKVASGNASQPFIIHAAEGIDARSFTEFRQLMDQGAINARTVLVHGLALPPDAAAMLNNCGAALIICPSSNQFLFDRIPEAGPLANVIRLGLGSDSPLTAIGDLLDELRFTHAFVGLHEDDLYRMVTTAPAQIFHLKQGEGRLAPGSTADFIATKDRGLTPAATLVGMASSDVELVVRTGRVFLASDTLFQRLPASERAGLELLIVDSQPRWIRASLTCLFRDAASVMDGDILSLAGKKVAHGHTA